MTITEFRNDPQLPGMWAMELKTNQVLKLVLELMEENHPARFALVGDNNDDVSATRAAIELGMTRGYSKYGDTLKLLAKAKPQPVDIGEPSYAKEEPVNA